MIRQGDIYYAAVADAGRRPVVIVSRAALNRGRDVLYVAFTTARLSERRKLPTCVFFRAGEFGLSADCVAQCDALGRLEILRLDSLPLGTLDDPAMRSVINAIGNVLDADCEPL